MNSGQHDRHGSFWLQNGLHRTVPAPIPLAAIAPTILRYFGIDIPLTMNGDLALAEE
jgi:bisphosphoglycerate-independent phosphoglycerate mutase (AlkP superfamily)